MPETKKMNVCCDFCKRSVKEAGQLLRGPGSEENRVVSIGDKRVRICTDCLSSGLDTMLQKEEEETARQTISAITIPKPKELMAYLDEYVIGQSVAKRALSIAVTNHFKRIYQSLHPVECPKDLEGTTLEKSNVLMIGPTGSGKTMLAKTLAHFLKVPFAIGDATSVTQAGYVGEDVENLLLRLIAAADYDIEAAEYGILFIDEIDKIGQKSANTSITRDVSGEGVQQSLLKIVEGTTANIPPGGGRKHPEQQFMQMDTENVLFICGGAFVNLKQIVENRRYKSTIGFSGSPKQENDDAWLEYIEPEDLQTYGLIPEFIGRFPVISYTTQPTVEMLTRILTEPKNSLVKQYKMLAFLDQVNLEFEQSALEEIANVALNLKTGARGLRAVMEQTLSPILFEMADYPTQQISITREMVKSKCSEDSFLFKKQKVA